MNPPKKEQISDATGSSGLVLRNQTRKKESKTRVLGFRLCMLDLKSSTKQLVMPLRLHKIHPISLLALWFLSLLSEKTEKS